MKIRILALLSALAALLTACGGAESTGASSDAPSETGASAAGTFQVYCFQAGKADAFLLWNDEGAVLIDTGESGFGKTILTKLSELGITRLDYLIITHFDKDHVGGAKKLLSDLPVGTVLQSNSPKEDADAYENYVAALAAAGIEPVTVREELTFTLGGVTCTVNPPARETYAEDASNNSSLIVTVTHGANRLLFCGDAENLRLAEFLERDPGLCAFVKLPHHGQYQKTLKTLLELTGPTWALITSSEDEPEEQKTLDLLESYGVEPLLTRASAWLVTSDGKTLTVSAAP